jgi:signal transduction histidine kinase
LLLHRFHRLRSNEPGAGLGLAIVKEIAALFGGSVVAQAADRRGFSVTITFPSVAATTDQPRRRAEREPAAG